MSTPAPSLSLSPPWLTLQKKYANTFSYDPAVLVDELDMSQHPYILPIVVDNEKKGIALRTIIPTLFPMGTVDNYPHPLSYGQHQCRYHRKEHKGSWIDIENDQQFVDALKTAFTGNPIFAEVIPCR